MSKQVRFRRGTTAQHTSFTGALAEVTVDTDKKVAVVHNASTVGGVPLLREDRPRGFTKTEIITTTGQIWTSTGKTDLKRIRVTCYGGGGGGTNSNTNAGGGGAGGYGFITLDVATAPVSANVTCTIGGGGATGATGGTTSFGSYISSSGGSPGAGTKGGQGGSCSGGSGAVGAVNGQAVNMGAQAGSNSWQGTYYVGYTYNPNTGTSYSWNSIAHATGGGPGGARYGAAAMGIRGGGGAPTASGAQGCIIVEEIYGFV
jgi:hypothetical protein